jgi:hypothetical protein
MFTISAARRGLLALAAVFAMSGQGIAEEVTFVMNNGHPYIVEVELYSQDRDHVWPGNGQVYVLNDSETKQIPLSCEEGETICYGAWVQGDQGTYWGVGPNNSQACEGCCYTCEGGSTEEINLVE